MPKYPFSELIITPQWRFKNKGFKRKENTGIDSETLKGYTKLLCDSSGRYKLVESFGDILNFLTHSYFYQKQNWFFNIQFDFESMVKHLEYRELVELYKNHEIEYNTYLIYYIPKKFFSIRDKNKQHFYFYDINAFLESSLNKVSKKFLGKEKLNIINASKLNKSKIYWKKYLNQIIKYCLHDALLTKEVSDYFWNLIFDTLQFQPKRPFSKGRLAEEYFLSKCYVPTINDIPKSVLNYSWMNYSGGRFEILKRGFFPEIYTYDIKSAYPSIIANLYDINKGVWKLTREYDKESDLGFYYCDISFLDEYFSPFMLKLGSLNIYPNGSYYQYLNNFEIDFIRENFNNVEIRIIGGVKFSLHEEIFPYRDEIQFLYDWKERERDEDIKYCLKIVMNSYYGKKIQVTNFKTGRLFNPIEASLITSLTRIKLLKFGLQSPKNVICFSTDSVHSIEKLKYPKHPKLGDFAKDFEGKGWYIMSDIYSLINNQNKRKDKFRGFTIRNEDNDKQELDKFACTLEYVLEELGKGTIFEYEKERPLHLGECLTHYKKKTVKDINIFKPQLKKININGDTKRIWERDFIDSYDAKENSISSYPILFNRI